MVPLEATDVVSVITDAVSTYTPQILTVIGAGIGLGLVIWGGKKLWSVFKKFAG